MTQDIEMRDLSDYVIPEDSGVEDTEFDPAGWDDTIPLLMWAIRKGLIDKHLRAIGEVARERYRVLYPNLSTPGSTTVQGVSTTSLSGWYTTEEAAALELLGPDKKIYPTLHRGTGVFEYKGNRYSKRSMIGEHFRVPANLLGVKGLVKYVNEKVVQIVSVGRTRVEVRLVEGAWATRQNFVDVLKNGRWNIDMDDIDFIFGGAK